MDPNPLLTARVLIQTLKLTRTSPIFNSGEIAEAARTTPESVERVLGRRLGFQDTPNIQLEPFDRFKLAIDASKLGALQEAAKSLTWQEFEAFGEECLSRSGFQTKKGVILKDATRKWQIDIVAKKTQMVLALDCKHWESPNYPSRFTKAAEHQKTALSLLLRSNNTNSTQPEWGLPVILTLYDPRSSIQDDVVLVSVGQLSDFVSHLTPYDPKLPFVSSELAESPISQR
jgi:Restriction endonuclease